MIKSDLNLIRGHNAYANEKYDLAIKYYLKDLEENPNSARALNNLAISYFKSKSMNISGTIKYFQQLINHPEINSYINKELIQNLDRFGLIVELNVLKNKIKREKYLAQIGIIIDVEESLKHIELVPMEDRDKDYYQLYAQISFALKNYQEALKHIDMAISLGSMNSKLFYLKSQSLIRINDFSRIKKVNKLYQIMLSFETKQTDSKQLDEMEFLMENNPKLKRINEYKYHLLSLLLHNNQVNQSLTLLYQLDVSKIKTIHREKILFAALKSQNMKVINALFQSSNIEKMSASEATLYCQSYKYISKQDDLQLICKQATLKFNESAALHFWYGILLLSENKVDEAIIEIETSIDFAPWMDEWRIHLAQIYLSLGQTENAIKVIDESISDNKMILNDFKLKNGLLNFNN